MSKRLMSWSGTLLLVLGLATLVGVGVSYARSSALPASSNGVDAATSSRLTAEVYRQNANLLHVTSAPGAVAVGQPGVRMTIPKIHVNAPIVPTKVVNGPCPPPSTPPCLQTADWAVGYIVGTGMPGEVGNMAVAAHDDIKGEIFKQIGVLKPGDKVFVYTKRSVFEYVVNGSQSVNPNDASVLDPSSKRELTMITCEPYWVDSSRLIVTAILRSSHSLRAPISGSHF